MAVFVTIVKPPVLGIVIVKSRSAIVVYLSRPASAAAIVFADHRLTPPPQCLRVTPILPVTELRRLEQPAQGQQCRRPLCPRHIAESRLESLAASTIASAHNRLADATRYCSRSDA